MIDLRDEKQKNEKRKFMFSCSVSLDGARYERGQVYELDEVEYQRVSRFVTIIK